MDGATIGAWKGGADRIRRMWAWEGLEGSRGGIRGFCNEFNDVVKGTGLEKKPSKLAP